MDRQSVDWQGVLEVVSEFLKFAHDDSRTMSLKSYLEEARVRRRNLVRVALSAGLAGAGYLAFFATIMSGVCEMARMPVAVAVSRFLSTSDESASWEIYLNSSPLAMGAFGIIVTLVGYILYRVSLEKYKARRGEKSIYPQYRCSVTNFLVSFLISSVPIIGIASVGSGHLTLEYLTPTMIAWTLSIIRTVTLAPRSVHVVNVLLASFVVSIACAPIGSIIGLSQNLIALSMGIHFIVHVFWACVLGINELRIWSLPRNAMLSLFQKDSAVGTKDYRTPRQWAGRSIMFYIAEGICLFIALCIVMAVPAFFISFGTILLSAA